MDLTPGTRLGSYEVVAPLGSGGMGIVYQAYDPRLKRTVAIKLLSPDLTRDETAKQRFLQEAEAASALDHPNICTVHDVGESDDGQLYLVMAHYEGETLKERIARGALPADEAVDIATQVGRGLASAHRAGVVHRDIKPANLFLTGTGVVKILDFGLAKLAGNEGVTQTGTTLGTVAYMSPEQARGEPIDCRTDIWSLGVVLYEMLAGTAPFRGDNLLNLADAIRSSEPEPLTGEVSRLNGVVSRAISKDLSGRFQTATELTDTLRSLGSTFAAGSSAESDAPSIAVLPFANISPERDQDYFCDGLAEELINALSGVKTLRVAARTSSFSFKGKDVSVREIAATLGVRTVLEGSVRKAGNRLRIVVQLVNASDGYHLWSARFDRHLEDVFAVQDEITLAIVEGLRVKLLGGERAQLLRRPTENQEAWTLYVKARHELQTFTTPGLERAARYSRQAIALDPGYAKAYVTLGGALMFLGGAGPTDHVPPHEAYPEARDAITRALALDGRLSEAHMMLGAMRTWFERDWNGAELAFKEALALNPHNIDAHYWYGQSCWVSNRLDQAMEHCSVAARLDPLATVFSSLVAHLSYCLRRYDDAREQFEQVLEIEPRFFHALLHLGDVYATTGDYARAEAFYERARAVVGEDSSYLSARLVALSAALGRHDEATRRLDALLERARRRYTPAGFIAVAYLGIGDHDRVFEWLDKSVDEGTALPCIWPSFPWSDPVRSDPRFGDLLRRLHLPAS